METAGAAMVFVEKSTHPTIDLPPVRQRDPGRGTDPARRWPPSRRPLPAARLLGGALVVDVSDLVEVAGLAGLAVAAFLVAAALGWLALGIELVLVAQGLDGIPLGGLVRSWVERIPRRPRRPEPV